MPLAKRFTLITAYQCSFSFCSSFRKRLQRYDSLFYYQIFLQKSFNFYLSRIRTLNTFPLLSRRECKDRLLFKISKLFQKKITRIFCPSILQPPLFCSSDQICSIKGRTLIQFCKLLGLYFKSDMEFHNSYNID